MQKHLPSKGTSHPLESLHASSIQQGEFFALEHHKTQKIEFVAVIRGVFLRTLIRHTGSRHTFKLLNESIT